MRDVRSALQGEPLDLLALVSSLVQIFDTTWPRSEADTIPKPADLLESLIETDRPETTALLHALAQLLPDELARRRITAHLAIRRHPMPTWLEQLGRAEVFGVRLIQHALDDGDNFLIGVAGPGALDLTIVAYVDHNVGTIVKDAFVVPEPLDAVERRYGELLAAESDTTQISVDAADARARIEPAIAEARGKVPPFESDLWPACKPLLEWALRLMPYGGAGYSRPEWSEMQRAALATRFWASEWGESMPSGDVQPLLDIIMGFGCDHSWRRDPLRWSPVTVEVFWDAIEVPDHSGLVTLAISELLEAWIRFSHHERRIPAPLTEQTVAAIQRWAPPTAVHPAGLGFDERDVDLDLDRAFPSWAAQSAIDAVGSLEALAEMTVDPLPEEDFRWDSIEELIKPRVSAVLALLDHALSQLPDREYGTAARRLLARIAAADPKAFTHARQKDEISAGTIGWLIAKANRLIPYGGMTSHDFMALFGLKAPSAQRAEVFLAAVGIVRDWGSVDLGDPDLLVSQRRRALRDYCTRHGLLGVVPGRG